MASKQMLRLDFEKLRLSFEKEPCYLCPIKSMCFELRDTEMLCDDEHEEDLKKAIKQIIEIFITDVEVVYNGDYEDIQK